MLEEWAALDRDTFLVREDAYWRCEERELSARIWCGGLLNGVPSSASSADRTFGTSDEREAFVNDQIALLRHDGFLLTADVHADHPLFNEVLYLKHQISAGRGRYWRCVRDGEYTTEWVGKLKFRMPATATATHTVHVSAEAAVAHVASRLASMKRMGMEHEPKDCGLVPVFKGEMSARKTRSVESPLLYSGLAARSPLASSQEGASATRADAIAPGRAAAMVTRSDSFGRAPAAAAGSSAVDICPRRSQRVPQPKSPHEAGAPEVRKLPAKIKAAESLSQSSPRKKARYLRVRPSALSLQRCDSADSTGV